MKDKLLICNGCHVCPVNSCEHKRTHIPAHFERGYEPGRPFMARECWLKGQSGCWQWLNSISKHVEFTCVEYTPEVYANLPTLDWESHDWLQSGFECFTDEDLYGEEDEDEREYDPEEVAGPAPPMVDIEYRPHGVAHRVFARIEPMHLIHDNAGIEIPRWVFEERHDR